MIYPWHEAAWRQIARHWDAQPNAWLFVGQENTGKTAFARHLAQALLCEIPAAQHAPCGTCPSCHLFLQGTHPDFYLLQPEQPENETGARKLLQIKIDAVRAVLEPLNHSSVRGGRRVVLATPAESMNTQAANALLKMLEEPPKAVVFILVSHSRDSLLPTIRSRCRQMLLPAPERDAALDYLHGQDTQHAEELLAFHSGAPLFPSAPEQDEMRTRLLDWLAAPRLIAALDFAAEYDRRKYPLALLLDWLHKWTTDIALAHHGIAPMYYPARAQAAAAAAAKTNPATLFAFSGCLTRLHPYGHHSLNVKMQTESLLCGYLSATLKKAA